MRDGSLTIRTHHTRVRPTPWTERESAAYDSAMVPRSLISPLAIALIVGGVLLAAIGAVYLVVAAAHLPGFLPGHVAVPTHALRNGRLIHTHADTKKGIFVL